MATPADWLSASRPRTLPAAIAPVLVGSGCGHALGGFSWWKAVLCLVVALALQIGVNFANDYSDGIRGTDTDRVGPMRLTGSGAARPGQVKAAAFLFFGIAGAAGLTLALTSAWWIILVGIASIAAAWFYTGGPSPYGYAGYGEVFVFVFFGLVAVTGTAYILSGRTSVTTLAGAIGIGLLACALLVANNLRDVESDTESGKRTLAVLLGAPMTRRLYAVIIAVAFLAVVVVGIRHPWCLIALLAVPLAVPPIRSVLAGARGPKLISVLGATGRLELVYAVLLTAGLLLNTTTAA
ncbi:1,4-dihydroxy-2-naphthoate polyprenyltransferase [Nakamurella antarctica]|uniref:1,4-dihydroxy-2-naphthoate octaprenyltransferase n=1 Tax=Nakamurella antarctica TaxID=1902245 RepID=A0A3G8ZN41_9ACTN|nr:1,4-dihydroxy-2-naphthoate polyprenyltransferase [Nakamurella antarctica]AZI58752.1 1,4-dihydroxy-2-naphthoate polyprenyltransferase [Nakamurella antarctica]